MTAFLLWPRSVFELASRGLAHLYPLTVKEHHPMTDRLTPEHETAIATRAASRAAALTTWLNRVSPLSDGQREVENVEAVLEEDVPALLAELAAVRAERDQAQPRVAELEGVLKCLASPEPCRWEGQVCVAHSWESDIGLCPHGQAQALLGGGQ